MSTLALRITIFLTIILAATAYPTGSAWAQTTPHPTPSAIITTQMPVDADAPPAPDGFQLIDAGEGAWLYRKPYANGSPDYVQVIDLSQGARVQLLHGSLTEARPDKGSYGGPDPRMTSPALETYWQNVSSEDPLAFCVINGGFFYMPEYPTRLAFPLKVDGQIITEGWGVKTYTDQKLLLEFWDTRADIQPLTKENLYASDAPNIVGGLTEQANKRAKFAVGRTFAGVADRDNDGKFETVLFLSTSTALQSGAANVLRDFGAEKVMMLDGGGSTQLLCRSGWHVRSDRPIPQALAILSGKPPDIEAEIVRVPSLQVVVEGERTPFEIEIRNTGAITWAVDAVHFVIDPGTIGASQSLPLRSPVSPEATTVFTTTLSAFLNPGIQSINISWRLTNRSESYDGTPIRLRTVVLPPEMMDKRTELEQAVVEWNAQSPQEAETRAIEWLAQRIPTLAPTPEAVLVTASDGQIKLQDVIWIPAVMLPIILILGLRLGRRHSG